MRPSLPPRELENPQPGFAPEGELALELAGFQNIPLIGSGRIQFLADQLGVETESLMKPSPVQALAATFAALSGNELQALRHSYPYTQPETIKAWISAYSTSPLQVHIFEDTPGGILAVQLASQILRNAGFPVTFYAWGIAGHPEKIAALKKVNAPVFSNTEEALQAACSEPFTS
jgi:hypothetical protein